MILVDVFLVHKARNDSVFGNVIMFLGMSIVTVFIILN